MSPSKKSQPLPLARNSSAWRFVGLFLVLLLGYFAFTQASLFTEHFYPFFQHLNVELIGSLLKLLGEPVRFQNELIFGPGFTLAFVRGCDSLDPAAMYICAIVAFPAGFLHKVIGATAGFIAMFVLNIGRVVVLYFVKLNVPAWYDVMHIYVFQAAFVMLAIGFWVLWVQWATRSAVVQQR